MKLGYFITTVLLFAIEVLIALSIRDNLIRPYVGDVLAVGLVYAALRTATPLNVDRALAATVAVAIAIELAQAFGLLSLLGLAANPVLRTVFGGVFDWADLAAYAVGAIGVLAIERARELRKRGGE